MLVLKGTGGEVDAVRFSPDGRGLFAFRVTFVGARVVEHWPEWSAGGKPVAVGMPDGVSAQELSPDARHLVGVRGGGEVVIHDRTTEADAVLGPGPRGGYVNLAAFTPDSRHVVASHGSTRTNYLTCRGVAAPHAVVWDVRARSTSRDVVFLDAERFVAFEYAPRGTLAAVARDAATGEPVGRARHAVPHYLQGLTTSPDRRLVVGHYAAKFLVCQAADLAVGIQVVPNTSRKEFTGIAFHPAGGYLAATSNDATVKLYDAATWAVVRTFDWDIGRLRSIVFSPDGTLAAAGGDKGRVVVWDFDG